MYKTQLPFVLWLSVWLILGMSISDSWAQSKAPSEPKQGPNEGLDSGRFATVDRLLDEAVSDEKVIGHNALVYKNGDVIYYHEAGMQNKLKKQPLKRDSIFRIYSMSKPITSVAVMQLVEQGKIDLDAPISKYLPALGGLKVGIGEQQEEAEREMTPRDLLRHTSGLTYGIFGNTPVDQAYRRAGILFMDENIEAMVDKLGKIPLLHQPGTRFHYSVSTDVLGRLVEVASGERFDDYLNENIFKPLEMKDTFFTVPKEKQDRLAQIYEGKDGKLKPKSPMSSIRFVTPNDFDSGGGGLCSTIDDYLQFGKMLLGRGTLNGKQLLKPETIDEMFKNQLLEVKQNSRAFKFGLGFRVFDEGDYGWGGAAGTRFWVNPKQKMVILYMVQINPYGRRKWGDQVRDEVYQAVE